MNLILILTNKLLMTWHHTDIKMVQFGPGKMTPRHTDSSPGEPKHISLPSPWTTHNLLCSFSFRGSMMSSSDLHT